MRDRIGFLQGRLSPPVNGLVQAFPWPSWEEEFPIAERLGFHLMEWTLDQDDLRQNPLLTAEGRTRIGELRRRHALDIPSLSGDCFMQAPFWKAPADRQDALKGDFVAVAQACAAAGIPLMVVPVVDNGRLETPKQEDQLMAFMQGQTRALASLGLRVAFEIDYGPEDIARFIGRLDSAVFGLTYDTGNSASLGFDPAEELSLYGHRVVNVHVKDRLHQGPSVPLGTGHVDFEAVFSALHRVHYAGPYVLQTARAADGDHVGALSRYRDMTSWWLSRCAA